MKKSMASHQALSALFIFEGLHKLFISQIGPLNEAGIRKYGEDLSHAVQEEYADAVREGRPCGHYWQDVWAPMILSKLVKQLFFAFLLSKNFDAGAIFFERVCGEFFLENALQETLRVQPEDSLRRRFGNCKRVYISKVDSLILGLPEQEGVYCEARYHGQVLAIAHGPNMRIASRRCCAEAINILKGNNRPVLPPCNCEEKGEGNNKRKR